MSNRGFRERVESVLDVPLFPISFLHELCHYLAYRIFGIAAEIHVLDTDRRAHVTIEQSRRDLAPRINAGVTFAPLALLLLSVPAVLMSLWLLERRGGLVALACFGYAVLLLLQSFPSENDIRTLQYTGWTDERIVRTTTAVNAVVWLLVLLTCGVGGVILGR